jgi:surface protein
MKTRSNRLNNGYVGGNFVDTSQYGVLPINKQATSNEWTRPTDWLPLPSMVEGDSKIAGLVAVYPGDTGSTGITASSNFVAFTVIGNYTVDWGDGTSASYSGGVTASKQYLWEGASADTLTYDGFRQRVFQITPQAGAGLTQANFVAYYPGVTLQTNYSSPILDLKISGASLAIIIPPKGMIQFEYVGNSSITTVNSMFSNCRNLRTVIGTSWTKNCTKFNSMFNSCTSLQTVPLFNTAIVNDFTSMFSGCTSLQTVPLFNTELATIFFGMFQDCTSLKTVPLFNTARVTTFGGMFSGCTSLQTVPLFNTASAVQMGSMFKDCKCLKIVPLFNTEKVAGPSGVNTMFQGCTSLQTVPLFNTALSTNFTSMFNGCVSLQTVPLFNTALSTNFSTMFQSCLSLQTVPLFNTALATSFSGMFANCASLKSAALGQPTKNLSYLNCALSAAELNRIFTNLATVGPPSGTPLVYQATITITGNWGVNQCNVNIAYGRNWQVIS